ncbi:MAG: DUF3341 domain-containing protein [Myxococcales bacterium]|nr:DUF3341 domain-containing protein [Myxococcales bacterium]
MRSGLLARFAGPDALAAALTALRDEGYARLDAYTPCPDEAVDAALGGPPSPLARFVLAGGLSGAGLAYLVLWWTQAVDYPLNIGGRPAHAPLAYVPLVFEGAVLCASLTAFVGFLLLCGLPRLWHPLFEVSLFERASIDGWLLAVDDRDPRFDDEQTTARLQALGAEAVVEVAP